MFSIMLTGIFFFPDRWIHPASGRIYSYSYKPPKVHGKDDITGEDLVQRPDDNPDKVRTRLDAYEEVRTPMLLSLFNDNLSREYSNCVFLFSDSFRTGDITFGQLLRWNGSSEILSRNYERCYLPECEAMAHQAFSLNCSPVNVLPIRSSTSDCRIVKYI